MAHQITLNGQLHPLEHPETIQALVQTLQLDPNAVAIEVNHEIIPKSCWHERPLQPGDRVEVVEFIGGG